MPNENEGHSSRPPSFESERVSKSTQIIEDFRAWMEEEGISWNDVSRSKIVDYGNSSHLLRGMNEHEVQDMLRVIYSRMSQKFHSATRHSHDWIEGRLPFVIRSAINDLYTSLYENWRNIPEKERLAYYTELRTKLANADVSPWPDVLESLGPEEIEKRKNELFENLDQLIKSLEDTRVRLTRKEAEELLHSPGTDSIKGLRDTSLIALMLCTGLREAEVRALDVADLDHEFEAAPALHVPEGTGCTERLIPFGDMLWVLGTTEAWLSRAGIMEGAVFRGFLRDGSTPRQGRIGLRSIRLILDSYPIVVNGERVTVTPLDLRRTYAAHLFAAGMDIGAIQENLGVSELSTAIDYIGNLYWGVERLPPSLFAKIDPAETSDSEDEVW